MSLSCESHALTNYVFQGYRGVHVGIRKMPSLATLIRATVPIGCVSDFEEVRKTARGGGASEHSPPMLEMYANTLYGIFLALYCV